MSNALIRTEQNVARTSDEYGFQRMCLHIYEEVYRSPGASHYGRRGQEQPGLDIFAQDWAHASGRFQGWVWIQCKHTGKDEVPWKGVRKDILDAANAVRAGEAPGHVYLFVVATAAPNDKKLHAAYAKMEERETLPFEVEFHSWDKLCSFVTKSDRLWNLYGAPPGGVMTGYGTRVSEINHTIRHALEEDRLADARLGLEQLNPGFIPFFGQPGVALPPKVWKQAPDLRETLLTLFERAHDAYAAYELLQYELDLTRTSDGGCDALSMLAYLRTERIVGYLREAGKWQMVGTHGPSVAEKVGHAATKFGKLEGPPDVLASLALIVLMECDDAPAHDSALAMLERTVARAAGTAEEHNARVAHAVVRYFYVVRHDWTGRARFVALGDHLDDNAPPVLMGDPRLGQPFPDGPYAPVAVAGQDPLAPPTITCYPTCCPLARLRRMGHFVAAPAMPYLKAECRIYATGTVAYPWRAAPTSSARTISAVRVLDMRTIAALGETGPHDDLFQDRVMYASESSFECLVGYRAALRAFVLRTGESGAPATMLADVDRMLGKCATVPAVGVPRSGTIHIVPVYDNPPARLGSPYRIVPFAPTAFTLPEEIGRRNADYLAGLPASGRVHVNLRHRYTDRSDERSLACLLALEKKAPLLICDSVLALEAGLMGIGHEHPATQVRY